MNWGDMNDPMYDGLISPIQAQSVYAVQQMSANPLETQSAMKRQDTSGNGSGSGNASQSQKVTDTKKSKYKHREPKLTVAATSTISPYFTQPAYPINMTASYFLLIYVLAMIVGVKSFRAFLINQLAPSQSSAALI